MNLSDWLETIQIAAIIGWMIVSIMAMVQLLRSIMSYLKERK